LSVAILAQLQCIAMQPCSQAVAGVLGWLFPRCVLRMAKEHGERGGKLPCEVCQTEATETCQRFLCTPCCRKHADGVCPNHRPEGQSQGVKRDGTARQQEPPGSSDITTMVRNIVNSVADSGTPDRWNRMHATALRHLNTSGLMHVADMMHVVLEEDPALRLITVGEANDALRQPPTVNKHTNQQKWAESLANSQQLFVPAGDGRSPRILARTTAASSGSAAAVTTPRCEPHAEEDDVALISEADYDGNESEIEPPCDIPAAPRRPQREFPEILAADLQCSLNISVHPKMQQAARDLQNIEHMELSKLDMRLVPWQAHTEHLEFHPRQGSFLWKPSRTSRRRTSVAGHSWPSDMP
jgi:hypothetical protein